jgi:riboflavin kinase / FMN adenylyltransferase
MAPQMELVRGFSGVRARHQGAVVTIGTFDGLHLGHRALVREALDCAQRLSRRAMLLTFEPMPSEFLRSDDPPARLTNFRERWRLLEAMGLDAMIVLPFDAALRQTNGAQFVERLHRTLQVASVIVGYDFRFGRGAGADAAMLQAAGPPLGFDVRVVPPVLSGTERISSSAVRAALASGDLRAAATHLGRPYAMRGRIVRGERLGRQLGYPTANMRLRRRRAALGGIYAVRAHGIGSTPRPGVASLGTRPTVNGVVPLLETHVFDFAADLYGQELEIEFVAKIRDEVRFETVADLVNQMHRDAAAAREILAA